MTQRIVNVTKWLWCLLALQAGYWKPVSSIKAPIHVPKTVEAQAKFFQDFFSVQLSPHKLEFGHVCEDPNNWEQRYERKDYKNHRDMGKVRWGDKKGGYGEHYWDLNHAGHNNDNDHSNYDAGNDDDGSYKYDDDSHHDTYDEPSEPLPNYGTEDSSPYDPEKASKSEYDEGGRIKRAHQRTRIDNNPIIVGQLEDNIEVPRTRKTKEKKASTKTTTPASIEEEFTDDEDEETEEEVITVKKVVPKPKRLLRPKIKKIEEPVITTTETPLDSPESQQQYYAPQSLQDPYQPYERPVSRPLYQAELAPPPAPVPSRLVLEPSTGHIYDRVTGQAYVLRPLLPNTFPQN